MDLVKITGTNYVRDMNSMAIINNDDNEKNEYYTKLRLIKNQKEQINIVKSEIDSIKSEMQEIKSLMLQLLDKNNNG
jgi:hypothetical protein